MRIHLLGTFAVVVSGRRIEDAAWRLRKAKALIKLLALAPGFRLHREQVLDRLWPDLDPEAAGNNLRQTLHSARRTLDLAPGTPLSSAQVPGGQPVGAQTREWITLRDQVLAFDTPPWVDAVAFEQSASAALATGDVEGSERAVQIYAGELLPEDRYEEWTTERREVLRRQYVALLIAISANYEAKDEAARAVAALRRVLDAEPADEGTHVRLMRLLAATGQRHLALAQYRMLREALKRDLDAEPGQEAEHLMRELRGTRPVSSSAFPQPAKGVPRSAAAGARAAREPKREPAVGAVNVPAALSSFIGREQELRALEHLLGRARLITVTGPGGFGKTRLVLELAQRTALAYAGGVWWVDLAGLREPALAAQVVASAVGVRQPLGGDLFAALSAHLRERDGLLVLDNCEHVLAPTVALVDPVLKACPDLHVIATSREPLDVLGEVLYRIPPLAVPRAQAQIEELSTSEAVRLFVERARSVQLDFEVTPHNAETVAGICRRLDGMPLAIELAAARIRHLAPEHILERLGDRFHLLTGPQTAPHRHRTLEAAVAWSYDLLSELERRLFIRLTVFAGHFALEDAETVCAGEGVEPAQVLGLLSELIDKSLVGVEEDRHGRVGYRLLETLREYGHLKLIQTGDADLLRRRHRDHFMELVGQAESMMRSRDRVIWLDRTGVWHDNLRAALEWSLAQGHAPEALRMAVAMGPYWRARHPAEGREWLERALAAGVEAPRQRVAGLIWASELAMLQDDYHRASQLAEQAADLARPVEEQAVNVAKGAEHRARLAVSLALLGHARWHLGDAARAAVLTREALDIASALPDRHALAFVFHHCARVAWHENDEAGVTGLAGEMLELSRSTGDPSGMVESLALLGEAARWRRDYHRAAALFRESMDLARRWEADRAATIAPRLADVIRILGDVGQAEALYRESIPVLKRLGEKWFLMRSFVGLARLSMDRTPHRAARLLGAAQALRATLGPRLADQANFDRAVAAARSALGDEGFDVSWVQGQAMTLDEAAAEALAEDPPPGIA